jgi:hypothetical protein
MIDVKGFLKNNILLCKRCNIQYEFYGVSDGRMNFICSRCYAKKEIHPDDFITPPVPWWKIWKTKNKNIWII